MYTLIIYDITDDKIRSKVSEECLAHGLTRIQKSAFIGEINSQLRKSLIKKLEKILGDNKGNIQIFLICNNDIRFRKIISTDDYNPDEGDIVFL